MYMLDTNIIIFSIRHPQSECARRLAEHIGKDVCISVITYAELEYGILNSSNPAQNRLAMQLFLAGIRILDFDISAGSHFGSILAYLARRKADRPGHDRDRMIAAHARSLGCTLITDNKKDFSDIPGLTIDNWRVPGDLKS